LLPPAASIASPERVAPELTEPDAISSLPSLHRTSSESEELHNGR